MLYRVELLESDPKPLRGQRADHKKNGMWIMMCHRHHRVACPVMDVAVPTSLLQA